MGQHDFNITTADANTGISFRAAVNAALQALASTNSGDAAPAPTFAGQLWFDTLNGKLWVRNAANSGWNEVWDIGATVSAFAYTLLDDADAAAARTTLGFTDAATVRDLYSCLARSFSEMSCAISLAGTQMLTQTALSRGTTSDKAVASTAFSFEISGGTKKDKAAAETALASGTIPQDKWGIYRFSVSAETGEPITCTAGAANFTTGYADEATAIAALPATPSGGCDMGYVTVKTKAGTTFVGGTDALEGGTSGNVSSDTNYYPATATNTYTGTLSPVPTGYAGLYLLSLTQTNLLAAPTINLNGLGAKTVKKGASEALEPTNMPAYGLYWYNGTDLVLLSDVIIFPPHDVVTFTSSGSWTCPEYVTEVWITAAGGGGGGGGGGTTASIGGGGGGGGAKAYRQSVTVEPGTSYAITIGAGGNGGGTTGSGATGGTTSFAALLSLAGGVGGDRGNAYGCGGSGGAGNQGGGTGGSGTNAKGGNGGGTGGGCGGESGDANTGGGGGGGHLNSSGSSGGSGFLIIEY